MTVIVRIHGTSDSLSGTLTIGTQSKSFTAAGAEGTPVTLRMTLPASGGSVMIGNGLVPGGWYGSASFSLGDTNTVAVDVNVSQVLGWGPVLAQPSATPALTTTMPK
jgi:hypothetical protein